MTEDLKNHQFDCAVFRSWIDEHGAFRMQIRKGFHHFLTLAILEKPQDPPADGRQWWELKVPDNISDASAIFGGDGPPCL